MKKHLPEIITTACLFAMPIDLLYLYYSGSWNEPVKMIEITELGLLYSMPFFAVWRFVKYIREATK